MLHLHPITEDIPHPAIIPAFREATAHLRGQAHPQVIQVLQGHTRHQVQGGPDLVAEEAAHPLQVAVVPAQAAAEEESNFGIQINQGKK